MTSAHARWDLWNIRTRLGGLTGVVHILHRVHRVTVPTRRGVNRMRLLGGRETASRLGVHENTLRAWEERGVIRAVRLPRSGFRRYREEDVSRLVSQMLRSLERPVGSDERAPETPAVRGHHDSSLWET